MPSKKSKKEDPILLALGDSPQKWDAYLRKTYGIPKQPQPRYEVSEQSFSPDAALGRQTKRGLAKVRGGEIVRPVPSEQWKRGQAFIYALVLIYAEQKNLPNRERDELLKFVTSLREWDRPLFGFPIELGITPQQFYRQWRRGLFEVSFICLSRAQQMVEIRYRFADRVRRHFRFPVFFPSRGTR